MNALTALRSLRYVMVAAAFVAVTLSPTSAQAVCGDGIFDQGEECDDKNTEDGDCCSSTCTLDDNGTACTDDGNQCTTDTCDGEGTCEHFGTFGAPCDDGNECTAGDSCDEGNQCVPEGLEQDGTSCDDDALCSGVGQCASGFCEGDPADCSGFGGTCNAAECNLQTGKCEITQLPDNTPCDNPSLCTDPGVCQSGECKQPPADCSAFEDDCNDSGCDEEIGCFSIPKENGIVCNDTNGCTDPGTCDDGECLTEPTDCSSFADQCNDAACNPKTEFGCFSSPKAGNPACDDGDPCTTGDACSGGICAGTPTDCSGLDDSCIDGVCNPQTGQCEAVPVDNGSPCLDGDFCTENDQCLDGQCVATPIDCSSLDDQCNTGVCSEQTGACVAEPVENGSTCSDGDQCTENDQCTNGECTGAAKDCSGLDDDCNAGTCNGQTGACEAVPVENGTPCLDGDFCTENDQCTNGECTATPVDCSSLDDECNTGVCSAQTGACVAEPAEDGTTCSDGDLCTEADQCGNGQCAGTAKDCSSLDDDCNAGACSAQTGACVAEPVANGTTCSDGDLCTINDECGGGDCAGSPLDCSAEGGSCTVGVCNPDSGQCEGEAVEDGSPCNDADACTTSDACTGGECAGTATDCSDLDGPCTTGVCNPNNGSCEAETAPDGTDCDDGAFCNGPDSCQSGACDSSGDPCTGNPTCSAVCDEESDACLETPGVPCEDDDNPCTENVCDGAGGCVAEPLSGPCDDGLFCTVDDRCVDSECVGDPACPPTEGCVDTCDEVDDACRTCGHPFSNSRCIVNAVFILQGAIGLRECELCTCDVDSSGAVMTTDSLLMLRTCVSLPATLDCESPVATTTSTSTSTTTTTTTSTTSTSMTTSSTMPPVDPLDGRVYISKYSCVQTFAPAGEPFCADLNEVDRLRFTHMGGNSYEVRDADNPLDPFVYNGTLAGLVFSWTASEPGEYMESGGWIFNEGYTTFSGASSYLAFDESYAGGCVETGAEDPVVPPDTPPLAPCP